MQEKGKKGKKRQKKAKKKGARFLISSSRRLERSQADFPNNAQLLKTLENRVLNCTHFIAFIMLDVIFV
jgi:hypothetical protein